MSNFLNEQIVADLNIKATDRHQYLYYMPLYSHLTKRSIVYNEAPRVSQIRSFEEDFETHETK